MYVHISFWFSQYKVTDLVGFRTKDWQKDSWGKKLIAEGQLKEELVCQDAWVWLPKM